MSSREQYHEVAGATGTRTKQSTIQQLNIQYGSHLQELQDARGERTEDESIEELVQMAAKLKAASKIFNISAKDLMERYIKIGSMAQANEVRLERTKNNRFSREYLESINRDLQLEGADQMSNITQTTRTSQMSQADQEQRRRDLFTELQKTRAVQHYEKEHDRLELERQKIDREKRQSQETLNNQMEERDSQIKAEQRRLEREKKEQLIEVELASMSQTEDQLRALNEEEVDTQNHFNQFQLDGPDRIQPWIRRSDSMSQSKNPHQSGYATNTRVPDTQTMSAHATDDTNIFRPKRDIIRHDEGYQMQAEATACLATESRPNFLQDRQNYVPRSDVQMPINNAWSQSVPAAMGASDYLMRKELFEKSSDPFAGAGQEERFFTWSALLENRTRGLQLTPMDHISILKANTVGEANLLVNNYLAAAASDPNYALQSIWNKLRERYGTSENIANNLRAKLHQFPIMKSDSTLGTKLRDLEDLCVVINAHLRVVPSLQSLNYGDGLRPIKDKLPDHLQNRWRKVGTRYKTKHGGQHPPFVQFVQFLSELANEFNDPSFFQSASPSRESSNKVAMVTLEENKSSQSFLLANSKQGSKAPVPAYSEADPQIKNCVIHHPSKHGTGRCHSFASLQIDERRKIAREEGLCYRCLGQHTSERCSSALLCSHCQSPSHHSLLHQEVRANPNNEGLRKQSDHNRLDKPNSFYSQGNQSQVLEQKSKISLCSNICGTSTQSKNCSKTLLVDISLPGITKTKLRCYAILDEQSTTTFADEKVFEFFKLTYPMQSYTISTLSGHRYPQDGRVLEGLSVRGVGELRAFNLAKTFENTMIPDTRNEVATPTTVLGHPHVAKYAAHFQDLDHTAEVLLLIGRDSGDVMRTTTYGEHHPFAHHTSLGWALVGPACTIDHEDSENTREFRIMHSSVQCNHEHFKAFHSFHKPQRRNIPLNPEEVFQTSPDDEFDAHSQEDKKFLRVIGNGIHVNAEGNLETPLPFKEDIPTMPNNQRAVYLRTKATLDKLKRDPLRLNQCTSAMGKTILARQVEQLSHSEQKPNAGHCWWIPLFPVIHPKKKSGQDMTFYVLHSVICALYLMQIFVGMKYFA